MAWDAAADVWSSMLPTRAGMLGILVQTSATVDPLLSLSSQRHAASCTVRKASCQCDTHVFAPKHATAQHSTHDVTIYEARRCCSVVVWKRGGWGRNNLPVHEVGVLHAELRGRIFPLVLWLVCCPRPARALGAGAVRVNHGRVAADVAAIVAAVIPSTAHDLTMVARRGYTGEHTLCAANANESLPAVCTPETVLALTQARLGHSLGGGSHLDLRPRVDQS